MISYLSLLVFASTLNFQEAELPEWAKERFILFSETFERSSQLNPSFIEYDLNNDKNLDIAILVKEKANDKTGILFLINGQENLFFLAGAGEPFDSGSDDFEWVDSWQVFNEKVTYEMTFLVNGDMDSEREILLENPALSLREEEGSGGLIYYDGDRFIWIHQGD